MKDLKDTKVKKDILCQSNNLSWNDFEDLLTLIGFDKNPLLELINHSIEETHLKEYVIKID